DRGGLRVAGSGRGDAADGVEAEHLNDVRQQAGGGADLGCVEVQLGDVARAVVVSGDDLGAGDRAAIGCLPLRPGRAWLAVRRASGGTRFGWMPPVGRASRLCWGKANEPSGRAVQA